MPASSGGGSRRRGRRPQDSPSSPSSSSSSDGDGDDGNSSKRWSSSWLMKMIKRAVAVVVAFIKRHRRRLTLSGYALLGFAITRVVLRMRSKARVRQAKRAAAKKVEVPFSEFLRRAQNGEVGRVFFSPQLFHFYGKNGDSVGNVTRPLPGNVPRGIVELLLENDVSFEKTRPAKLSWVPSMVVFLLPFLYLGGCGALLYKYFNDSMGGDVGKMKNGTASSPRSSSNGTSFKDVAGIDAAKQIVWEVSDFMKNPEKYRKLGAHLPSGILLVGPPGTGKTMLARAIANDAGVPFIYCTGSDFVEVFAGRGAGRVRRLFDRARKRAPAIIFFDEIDALGKKRTDLGMNEEREQTLNQVLAEMDGFSGEKKAPVLVIAATNRYDVLDSALTRPGRFDRIVRVELPNALGREEILSVHTRDKNLAIGTDLRLIAELTPKFSGADLSMIVNEAAIAAARKGRFEMRTEDFVGAVEMFKTSRGRGKKSGENFTERVGSLWSQFAHIPVD